MSKLVAKNDSQKQGETESKGPNLILLYALLALGLVAAMAFAAMVIWPFYLRRDYSARSFEGSARSGINTGIPSISG